MPPDHALPFLGKQQSLKIWLNSLNQIGSHRASNKLYDVLQMLYQHAFDPQETLNLLNELASTVLNYSDTLENIVIAQQCFKNEALVRKTANLSCQLLRLLSLNYCRLCQATDLKSEQQLQVHYIALYLIGLSLCKLACLNQFPSETLWKKTAEIYLSAKQKHFLNTPVTQCNLITSQQSSIAEILQRNFLFALNNLYYYNRDTIKTLFTLAEQHGNSLTIDVSDHQAQFAWSPKLASAPFRYDSSFRLPGDTLYFNCLTVINALKLQLPLKLIKQDFEHLYHTLGGYRDIMDSAIASETQTYQLIADTQELHKQLSHSTTIKNIQRLSGSSSKHTVPSPLLQLEPLHTDGQAKKSVTTSSNTTGLVSVHPTRFKDYYLTNSLDPELKLELPVLLLDKHGQAIVGIIRQLDNHLLNSSKWILIECIVGSVESIEVNDDSKTLRAIVITKPKGEKEILLPAGKYPTGMLVNTKGVSGQHQSYYLATLLGVSAHFSQFQLLEH